MSLHLKKKKGLVHWIEQSAKKNKDIINDFLEYDYVGAPWIITAYTFTKNCSYIGNGGFSLRRKSKIAKSPYKFTF